MMDRFARATAYALIGGGTIVAIMVLLIIVDLSLTLAGVSEPVSKIATPVIAGVVGFAIAGFFGKSK